MDVSRHSRLPRSSAATLAHAEAALFPPPAPRDANVLLSPSMRHVRLVSQDERTAVYRRSLCQAIGNCDTDMISDCVEFGIFLVPNARDASAIQHGVFDRACGSMQRRFVISAEESARYAEERRVQQERAAAAQRRAYADRLWRERLRNSAPTAGRLSVSDVSGVCDWVARAAAKGERYDTANSANTVYRYLCFVRDTCDGEADVREVYRSSISIRNRADGGSSPIYCQLGICTRDLAPTEAFGWCDACMCSVFCSMCMHIMRVAGIQPYCRRCVRTFLARVEGSVTTQSPPNEQQQQGQEVDAFQKLASTSNLTLYAQEALARRYISLQLEYMAQQQQQQ